MDYLSRSSQKPRCAPCIHYDLISELAVRGVMVTSRGSGEYDFVRVLCAGLRCAGGSRRRAPRIAASRRTGPRSSESRNARLSGVCARRRDSVGCARERVLLGGQAVTVARRARAEYHIKQWRRQWLRSILGNQFSDAVTFGKRT